MSDMKTIPTLLLAMLLAPIARGETTTSDTPAAVVSSFVREVSALATQHSELADFPEKMKQVKPQSAVEFKGNVKPFAVSFDKNITPVLTKRRIRPSDCGTNGIFLQFVLDDGTVERCAPIDTLTYLPNLKLTLYADLVLWEKASPELKKTLEDIVARHKAMLSELDKEAANQAQEDTARKVADPQR
jgi:hypothetical protein